MISLYGKFTENTPDLYTVWEEFGVGFFSVSSLKMFLIQNLQYLSKLDKILLSVIYKWVFIILLLP